MPGTVMPESRLERNPQALPMQVVYAFNRCIDHTYAYWLSVNGSGIIRQSRPAKQRTLLKRSLPCYGERIVGGCGTLWTISASASGAAG